MAMGAVEFRDEEPPDDAVVVIRGGLRSLDVEKVIELCEDSFVEFGFYGLSVFAASPHFDVVLPSLDRDIVDAMRACFEARDNPARKR